MRPGPGLVVMALAFLSGARRGGTTTISTSSSSTTTAKQQQQQPHHHRQPDQEQQQQQLRIDHTAADYTLLASNDQPFSAADSESGVLFRINPWLSACDLAQPATAPDLQGECTAGALPVPAVNEGPGPPECPPSCESLRLMDRNWQLSAGNSGSSSSRITNKPNHNNNNNNYNSKPIMSNQQQPPPHQTTGDSGDRQPWQRAATGGTAGPESAKGPPSFTEEDRQQCLDYFGDSERNSPKQLCAKAARGELTARLRTLRLRHCCERSVLGAIHNEALATVLLGGDGCVSTLTDLLDADALADRVTCELNDILLRYDCRQLYSIKHGCRDCKEAYRRWVCSTLIPFFAEPDDIRVNHTATDNDAATAYSSSSTSTSPSAPHRVHRRSSEADADHHHDDDEANGANDDGRQTKRKHHNHRNPHHTITNTTSTTTTNTTTTTARSSSNAGVHSNRTRSKRAFDHASYAYSSRGGDHHGAPTANSSGSSSGHHRYSAPPLSSHSSRRPDNQSLVARPTHGRRTPSPSEEVSHHYPDDPVIARLLRRSRRKSETTDRRKIRPCLSVCQTVEENCPYMLPNDRAPGLPTQYAGEPTFLCLDPNIPETGEQLEKSNSGPDNCCYRYCSASVLDGLCAVCDAPSRHDGTDSRLVAGSDQQHSPHHPTEPYAEKCPYSDAMGTQVPSGCLTPFQASVKSAAVSLAPHRTIAARLFHLVHDALMMEPPTPTPLPTKPTTISYTTIRFLLGLLLVAVMLLDARTPPDVCYPVSTAIVALVVIAANVSS